MSSIPGAVFSAGKIRGDMKKFRRHSVADANVVLTENKLTSFEKNVRGRSASLSPPSTTETTPVVSPANSARTMFSVGLGVFSSMPSALFDAFRLKALAADYDGVDMRPIPTAGSITDLVNLR